MSISVIVCTRNRSEDLRRYLCSLDKQTQMPDELIIVDASEDEETRDFVERRMRMSQYVIKHVRCEPGLTKQRNRGIKESKGKYLFFFDDDVVLDPEYLQVSYETFDHFEGKNIGGVTGRITNISKNRSALDALFKKIYFLTEHGKGRLKKSGFPEHRSDDKLAFVEVFSGCSMAYKREVFSKYLFDERLTDYSYMEDVDFSYRVSRKYKLIYQPEAKLVHLSTTYKSVDSRFLRRMMVRNHCYLFRKNLPKDVPHIFGFAMSIVGLLLYNGVLMKDIKACIGVIEGILRPLKVIERPDMMGKRS